MLVLETAVLFLLLTIAAGSSPTPTTSPQPTQNEAAMESSIMQAISVFGTTRTKKTITITSTSTKTIPRIKVIETAIIATSTQAPVKNVVLDIGSAPTIDSLKWTIMNQITIAESTKLELASLVTQIAGHPSTTDTNSAEIYPSTTGTTHTSPLTEMPTKDSAVTRGNNLISVALPVQIVSTLTKQVAMQQTTSSSFVIPVPTTSVDVMQGIAACLQRLINESIAS